MSPRCVSIAIEQSDRLAEVRDWVASIHAVGMGRVEQREFRTRLLGSNQLPVALVLDTVEHAARLVPGGEMQLEVFRRVVEVTTARRPGLMPVLARRPFDAITAADVWDRLLDFVDWMDETRTPGGTSGRSISQASTPS